jgi:hypothetical protein
MLARRRRSNALERPSKVRGRPFQPGNPGRPPGSKNKTTRLVEQLVEGDAEELSRKMLELAKKGNVRCLEYWLDRLVPKRSGRPLDLQLPAIKSVHDLTAGMAAVTTAVNNGDLTAEEATHVIQWFECYVKIFTVYDLAVRLEALESEMKKKGRDLMPSQRITKFGKRLD